MEVVSHKTIFQSPLNACAPHFLNASYVLCHSKNSLKILVSSCSINISYTAIVFYTSYIALVPSLFLAVPSWIQCNESGSPFNELGKHFVFRSTLAGIIGRQLQFLQICGKAAWIFIVKSRAR